MNPLNPNFYVLGGDTIEKHLSTSRPDIVRLVRDTYLKHWSGRVVNPDSYFLRFKDRPEARIIALPAAIQDETCGIKWISSYPDNIKKNLQRASAVLVINDYETGYPVACMEASRISAARTAGSAVLAAQELRPARRAAKIAFIGAGIISREILAYFNALDWKFERVDVHDLVEHYASRFAEHATASTGAPAVVRGQVAEAIADADIVVLATTAAAPYICDPAAFTPSQLVLNVSLRDISADIILRANNIVDDVDHCLKANTSPHLAEQQVGHRDFINGTLAQLMNQELSLDDSRCTIFSPFGLGVLDLAVGQELLRRALEDGSTQPVPGFFGNMARWA